MVTVLTSIFGSATSNAIYTSFLSEGFVVCSSGKFSDDAFVVGRDLI